ncbi:hypothetical protein IQ269_25500 [Tychonema sp. LEGE 07199]|uniref:hypothetical protein n=1 Tax=unclassified Tychonema TaxID=2642144 RepID=UPI00187E8EE8|nr:hypothetical protein [Tychonema sp. LEGE 07199]MBE9124064.1 hypothetical protein [Tychonema sp. LEGE 07199]MBE9133885.1 hypothetical protein [Tychonema sp. LEGE 07196]
MSPLLKFLVRTLARSQSWYSCTQFNESFCDGNRSDTIPGIDRIFLRFFAIWAIDRDRVP